jgi:hypothetical protein
MGAKVVTFVKSDCRARVRCRSGPASRSLCEADLRRDQTVNPPVTLWNPVGQTNYPISPERIVLVKERSRRLLPTTNTLEKAIAAPASIGLSRPSATSGIAATL